MKKLIKPLVIIICSLILAYGLFVGVDCVRLYNAETSKAPIIITQPTETENDTVKYIGLGYTVTYKVNEEKAIDENESSNVNYAICGAEFRLFDKILLWAWVE